MLKINILLLVGFSIISLELNADCNYNSPSYHTVAKTDRSTFSRGDIFYANYKLIEPYFFINDYSDDYHEAAKESVFDYLMSTTLNLKYDGRKCSEDQLADYVVSDVSSVRSIRFKNCIESNLPADLGVCLISSHEDTIIFPKKLNVENSVVVDSSFENLLKSYVKRLKVKITPEYEVDLATVDILGFEHAKIDNVGTLYSRVILKIKGPEKELVRFHEYDQGKITAKLKVDAFHFNVFILSNKKNNEFWHIADNGVNYCGEKLGSFLITHRGEYSDYFKELDVKVTSSYDIDDDGRADLISLESDLTLYQIKFKQEMRVIRDDRYRVISWDEDYGSEGKVKQ